MSVFSITLPSEWSQGGLINQSSLINANSEALLGMLEQEPLFLPQWVRPRKHGALGRSHLGPAGGRTERWKHTCMHTRMFATMVFFALEGSGCRIRRLSPGKVASRWLQLSLLLQSWAAPRSILSIQRQQETSREAGADRSAIATKLLGSQATSILARRGQGLQGKSQPSPDVESQDVFIPCFISESSGHIPPRREEGHGNFCRAPLSRVTEPLSLQSS